MASLRRRERNFIVPYGTTTSSEGAVLQEYNVATLWQRVDDTYKKTRRDDGTWPPSGLRIQTVSYSKVGAINGTSFGGNFVHQDATLAPGAYSVGSSNFPTEPSVAELRARLLASSNPFRYVVSAPVLIFELLEAVSILKFSAKTLASFLGSAYLKYKFEYATLESDIKSLAKITETIEQRIHEFNSLVKKGGLRRKIHLFSDSHSTSESNKIMWSTFGLTIRGDVKSTYKTKIWGTVRWRPKKKDLIPTEKLEVFNLAVRQVFDLEAPDAATIWEVIPFSWAIDYFTTLGDTLKGLEASELVEPYDLCIMWERSVESVGTPLTFPDTVSVEGYRNKRTVRDRAYYATNGIGELLRFGLISENQAVTLTALIASRQK